MTIFDSLQLTDISLWVAIFSGVGLILTVFFTYHVTGQHIALRVRARQIKKVSNNKNGPLSSMTGSVVSPEELATRYIGAKSGFSQRRAFRSAMLFGWALPTAYWKYLRK